MGVQNGGAVIEWRECDGPRVTEPTRRGFGSRLLDEAMPRASGRATLTFDPDGISCEIRVALNGVAGKQP